MQSVRIRIARHIQPVAGHVLAVAFRLQQAGHHFFISLGTRVSQESIHLRSSRRQSGQVQCHTPDQCFFAGFWCRLQSFFGKACLDESIDWSSKFQVVTSYGMGT